MPSQKELVGIGVDAVSWNRLKRFLDEHPLESVERLLSASERKSFRAAGDPLPFLARAFAAKEAYFKASNEVWLGGPDSFREIEVVMEEKRFRIVDRHCEAATSMTPKQSKRDCFVRLRRARNDAHAEGEFFEMPEGLGARVFVWKRATP